MGGWALSIDFGTSNSAAAHTSAVSGRIETLPLTHHSNLLSSSVAVGPERAVLTGSTAAAEADRNPTAFVASPKRLVGQVPSVRIGDDDIALDVLIAGVLTTVLDRALAAHNGQPPSRVVLTHPEAWSPPQIAVLVAAAARAGIDPATVVTVSEPRAAAHHYSRATSANPGTRLAVFDFGGGTLDVAVLTATETGSFEVVAARGDNSLGGKNFDARLRRWVETTLADDDAEAADALRRAPAHVQRAVDEQVRRAKEMLSESPSASITVDTGRHRRTVTITRAEYDALIAGDIDRAAALARTAFTDAGVGRAGDLAALYLTGGSARTPLVHTRIGQLGPVATLDDPKTVVAQGALLAVDGIPIDGGLETVVLKRPEALPPHAFHPIMAAPEKTEPTGPTGGRRKWVLVAGSVVAVLVVVGVVVAVERGMSGDSVAGAEASSATSGAGGFDGADPRNVTTKLPQPLAGQVQDCVASGFSTDGDLSISCEIPATSVLAADRVRDAVRGLSITATAVDETTAMQKVLTIRSYTDPVDVRENPERSAALDLSNLGTRDNHSYMVTVTNAALGLTVNVHNVKDSAAAEAFVNDSGLFG